MIKNINVNIVTKCKNIYKIVKDYLFLIIMVGFVLCIFKEPDVVVKSVSSGLSICGNVVLPSLFPFMVICGFVNLSPMVEIVSKIFLPVTRFIFKLPENVGCLVFMSFIGGYPMGAKMVSDALKRNEISTEVANRLMCFCVNAGPAFVVTAIGYVIWGNIKIGLVLLISHILGSIIIATFLGVLYDNKEVNSVVAKIKPLKYSEAFVKSVIDGSYAILHIFSFVIIFSVVVNLIKSHLFFNGALLNVVLSFLEITVGMKYVINLDGVASLLLSSFLISFSGLSIIFQIFYFVKDCNLNKKKIVLFRFIHGGISALITYFMMFFIDDIKCTSIILYGNKIEFCQVSPLVSIVIFLLALTFIIFTYDEIF